MGIENARWTPCPNCGRNDLLDIDLLTREQVPQQFVDLESHHKADLYCPGCRARIVSFEKSQTDKDYAYYKMDFRYREKRLKARNDRIAEADPTSERLKKAYRGRR